MNGVLGEVLRLYLGQRIHNSFHQSLQMSSEAMLPNLDEACGKLEDLLKTAKDKPINGGDVPGNMFLPAVAVYKDLFDHMAVKTTEAFDKKLKSTTDIDAQKAITKLRALEVEWNQFLTTVNPETAESERNVVAEGEIISGPINLVNARTCVETDLQTLLSSSDSSYLHLILLRYLS